jgi:hypothetical protein
MRSQQIYLLTYKKDRSNLDLSCQLIEPENYILPI